MQYKNYTFDDLTRQLSSKAPTPSGGGAASMTSAIGISLANMVVNLTIGKKKEPEVEKRLVELGKIGEELRVRFLELVDEDALNFEPLQKLYSKKDRTPEEMENALEKATLAPMEIMKKSLEAIKINKELLEIGSKLAISDAKCGIEICYTGLKSAYYNVKCNTNLMKDLTRKNKLENIAEQLLEEGEKICQEY